MNEVIVATDVVLRAIIRPSDYVANLLDRARKGEVQLVIMHEVLYYALYSISSEDTINTQQLAELIQYSQILPHAPEFLGAEERRSWIPNSQQVEHWRRIALEED